MANRKTVQHDRRVHGAYGSIEYLGYDGSDLQHFAVASQSHADVSYAVARNLYSGLMHCTCSAGIHERASCIHREAVARWVSEHR